MAAGCDHVDFNECLCQQTIGGRADSMVQKPDGINGQKTDGMVQKTDGIYNGQKSDGMVQKTDGINGQKADRYNASTHLYVEILPL
jgi:hypothetical protein